MTSTGRGRARLLGLSAAVGALVLLGLGAIGPAYAAKPDGPPGQAKKAAAAPAAPTTPAKTDQGQPPAAGKIAKVGSTEVHRAGPSNARAGSSNGKATGHATSGTAGTSGDVSTPQPRSNADDNGGGANHTGPYDSTRDGSPSMNGNGKGKATGKPCAGCVGKADNKNPKGQYPDGTDHNVGYECDGNHGVGRTNPAHTGCRPAPPPPPVCVDNPATPEDECASPPPVCVDNPATLEDECGEVSPPEVCVDNPLTPQDECGEVSPPGTNPPGTNPPGVSPPGTNPPGETRQGGPTVARAGATPTAATLPATGSPAGLGAAMLSGLVLLGGGGLLLRRTRHS